MMSGHNFPRSVSSPPGGDEAFRRTAKLSKIICEVDSLGAVLYKIYLVKQATLERVA